ncbi:hypothetical protein FNF31_06079 [Cafeteria roenbergensis]|uniref:Calmodulin-lysine N-methyltransferase n=1 Tax=Cafeteria roenbergensis TaxID=33653 RepID=A0A5A8CTN4_CAFRO|nr:hypothetical protein FNF31_06079 [Cafeteria roenbergensis]
MSGRGGAAKVDNTGNVRVWPAEEALAVLLARWRGLNLLGAWGGASLLEFGAGRSGLAGLALASSAASREEPAGSNAPPRSVVVTDGHPRAAADLARQCALTQMRCGLRCPLKAATLVWTTDPRRSLGRPKAAHFPAGAPSPTPRDAAAVAAAGPTADAAAEAAAGSGAAAAAAKPTATAAAAPESASAALPPAPLACTEGPLDLGPASVDCILAADVAFFERFHDALLETAAHLLKPAQSEGLPPRGRSGAQAPDAVEALSDASLAAAAVTAPGSLVVLAPSRGGSLERLELAARAFPAPGRAGGDGRVGPGGEAGSGAAGGDVHAAAAAATTADVPPAFSVRRIDGVGPWLSAAALGGAPIEGHDDAAAGPLQLLIIQRLADPPVPGQLLTES